MYVNQDNCNRLQPIGSIVSGKFPLTNHTGSEEPQRASQTEQETIALHEAISQVSKLVSKLQDRLITVLRQPYPQTQGSDTVAEESIPALANAIRQSRYVAQNSANQLQDILERLDI